jgi:dihydroxyacid dehydratase/phosphogluconate dehydratase
MDATTHIESRLPRPHVNGRHARASHRPAIAHAGGIASDLFDGAEISVTPYNIPDLEPAGQYVDKELFNTNIIIARWMRTLLDNGSGCEECRTVSACHIAKNLRQVALRQVIWDAIAFELSDADLEKRRAAWEPRRPAFGSGYLWTFAFEVGPARHGAVTHPGNAVEKTCHADI